MTVKLRGGRRLAIIYVSGILCLLLIAVCGANAQSGPAGSYIGLTLREVTPDVAKTAKLDSPRGVVVLRVEDDSPAEKAGLQVDDILLSYNGEAILGQQQLRRLVSETPPDRKVRLEFWRDGKSRIASVMTETIHRFSPGDALTQGEFPSSMVPGAIPSILLAWRVPILGIECEPLTAQLAEFFGAKRGVLIRSIESDSGAEKAGLKAGDVLISIGNQPVNGPRDLTSFARSPHEFGKPVALLYVRGRKEFTTKFNAFPDVP